MEFILSEDRPSKAGICVGWITTQDGLRGNSKPIIRTSLWAWKNHEPGDLAAAFNAEEEYQVFCFDRDQYSADEALEVVCDEMRELRQQIKESK